MVIIVWNMYPLAQYLLAVLERVGLKNVCKDRTPETIHEVKISVPVLSFLVSVLPFSHPFAVLLLNSRIKVTNYHNNINKNNNAGKNAIKYELYSQH
jgi:hypothetical protein